MSTLNTPRGYGAHGRPAVLRLRSGRAERATPDRRRWVEARDTRAGDCFRGPKTLGIYSLLQDPRPCEDGSGLLELLVLAPSGAIRTWRRRPAFQLERA